MSDVISWGNQVGNWRCGVAATVTEVDRTTARVTVTSVWQSLGYGFNVRYCSAFVSLDGSGDGTSETIHAYSANGSTVQLDAFSKTYTVERRDTAYPVAVAASFVMPDFQPGSSYASATVEVPAMPHEVPGPVTGLDAQVSGNVASITWFNNADPAAFKPYTGIRVQEGKNGELGETKELPGDATGTTWTLEANSRYGWDVWPYNNAGIGTKAWVGHKYTAPPRPASVLGTFDGSKVALTWTSSARYPLHHEVSVSGDGGSTWVVLGTATATSYTDAKPPAGTALYRVRTVAADGTTWGDYGVSDTVPTYTSADYPTVTFPTLAAAHDVPYRVTWTVGGPDPLRSQRVEVVVGNEVVQAATLDASARSYEVGLAGLVDGGTATVRVTATDTKGLTTVAAAAFPVAWWPPAKPKVTATQDGLGVFLAVSESTPGTTEAQAASYEAVRGVYTLASVAGGFTDPVPPINAVSRYTVTATAANGLTSAVEVAAEVASKSGAVTAGSTTMPLALDMSWSETVRRGGSAIHFAGQELPEWFGSGELSTSCSAKATVDMAELERLRDVLRSADTVWLRDPMGHVAYGGAQLSWSAKGPNWAEATVKLTETEAPHGLG